MIPKSGPLSMISNIPLQASCHAIVTNNDLWIAAVGWGVGAFLVGIVFFWQAEAKLRPRLTRLAARRALSTPGRSRHPSAPSSALLSTLPAPHTTCPRHRPFARAAHHLPGLRRARHKRPLRLSR